MAAPVFYAKIHLRGGSGMFRWRCIVSWRRQRQRLARLIPLAAGMDFAQND
ncbi:MAG: hypothetical protein PUI81_10315 [Veillonellaceae bacterium]|nr:hypothetical protein [Veillonellaceae bacterium]MDD6924477.1 hypothetical protein [Veillonellaceae bacterium]